ncbi:MerR family transcriptional regulator [Paenibacillus sp. FSL R7-0297]|uniref:MerR family transcriptional regulator n=1 Tax=Paenibacillus sp. FSL R7-0297 TaxID=2921680 RepID=UPI0030F7D060
MLGAEITIGELAELMQVSVHQIRYFEEKGVLLPSYTDTNQYRKYGIDQIYQLSQIMLLRKLGMPVQAIKESMAEDGEQVMEEKLHHSLGEVGREIARLQQLEQLLLKVLHEQRDFQMDKQSYSVKMREALQLQKWFDMDSAAALDARTLVEQSAGVNHLFETDIHYVYDRKDTVSLYTALERGRGTGRILPAGNYLSLKLQVKDESGLEKAIEQFSRHAEHEYGELPGPLILIEKSYLSLFSQGMLHYEILLCIETEAASGVDPL